MGGNEERIGWVLVAPALLLLAAFVALPLLGALVTSLHVETPFAPRRFVGVHNYQRLAADDAARATFGFTVFFALTSTLVEVVIGLGFALAVQQTFRGRGVVRAAMLVPWAVPTVVAAVMWKYMFNDQYGLVNLVLYGHEIESYRAWLAAPGSARLAIVVADVWKTTGVAALLLLAGLEAIPADLHEAARIDGAGSLRRFLTITLPLLRPAILLAVLFRLIDAFRVFDLVYVMTQGAPGGTTSVLQFYGYQKMFPEQQLGYGSAVSVVVFAMVAVAAALVLRTIGARMLER